MLVTQNEQPKLIEKLSTMCTETNRMRIVGENGYEYSIYSVEYNGSEWFVLSWYGDIDMGDTELFLACGDSYSLMLLLGESLLESTIESTAPISLSIN